MEYVELITKIVEVEQTAQKISNDAKEKLKTIDEVLDKEREVLHDSYFDRARRRVESARERENEAADEMIAGLKAKLETELRDVNRRFEERREAWALKIFSMVIGN